MFSDEQLLGTDFDSTAYLRHTLQLPSFDAEQSRIARCIDTVDAGLQAAIADNAGDLVDNVAQLNKAAGTVESVQQSVHGAQSSLARLRHVIHEPYVQVEAGVAELRNSTAALELMRAVYRFLSLATKLQESQGDMARSARLLHEIEELVTEHDLAGIEAVDAAMVGVTKSSAVVRTKALELLRGAMARRAHADMGLAVQCFASLGTLGKVVSDAVADRKRDALTIIVKQLSPAALQGQGDQALSKIDAAMQAIVEHASALAELWKALRRRDAATQRPFVDLVASVADPKALLGDFWKAVSEHLAEHLHRMSKKGALHAMVIAEFAQFRRTLVSFCNNLRDFFAALAGEARDSPAVATMARAKTDAWIGVAVGDLEPQFRQALRDRHREKIAALTSRVNGACPQGGAEKSTVDISVDPRAGSSLPSAACTFDSAVRGIVKAIQHDLAANRPDEHSLALVLEATGHTLGAARKALSDGLSKVPLKELPSGVSATAGHLFQISLSNAATLLAVEVQSAIAMLPRASIAGESTDAAAATRAAVADLQSLCERVVAPFFDSACVTIPAAIDGMFTDDGKTNVPAAASPSTARAASLPSRGAGGSSGSAAANASERGTQLHTRVWHFVTRFGLLFDHQTPGIEGAQRKLAAAISRHFLANTLLCTFDDDKTRRTLAADLESLAGVLGTIFAVDRLGSTGRALRHAMRLLSDPAQPPKPKEVLAWGARGHPAALLLALLGCLDAAKLSVDLTTATKLSRKELRKTLLDALAAENVKGCGRLWEAATRSCLADIDVDETEETPDPSAAAAAAPAKATEAKENSSGDAGQEEGDEVKAEAEEPAAPAVVPTKSVPTAAAQIKKACLALEELLVPR